jgi:hypothetical protein
MVISPSRDRLSAGISLSELNLLFNSMAVSWLTFPCLRWVVKDVKRIVQEKELDINRLRKEIEALHRAIPMLAEDRDWVEHGLAAPPRFQQSRGSGTAAFVRQVAFRKDAEAGDLHT